MSHKEADFEAAIVRSLVEDGGYIEGDPSTFNAELGLFERPLVEFVQATQPDKWDGLVKLYGNSAGDHLVKRAAKQMDDRGTVDVLRHGFDDQNVKGVKVAYFRPAHGLTPKLEERYRANTLTITRQVAYEPKSNKTLDLVLSVNGIPVATAELKNELTGQNVGHAMKQYRKDRDPHNTTLSKRAVVHFAVDPYEVMMTTRLAGDNTMFLPFNLGHEGGKGNPPNEDGYRTSYLWENIWERNAWLDLLGRFIHIETPEGASKLGAKKQSTVIFPRFHQWDTVRYLEAAAKKDGPDETYLVQHSAGSGKSNSIAWLAHRLSNLHDADDKKVFDKVVVITDRRVLDFQLQQTISQFEHTKGVVQRIDENSKQLAAALAGEQAKIIITTLQKFPFVMDHVDSLADRNYAVIIDEAHSSQTGEAAKELRAVLGDTGSETVSSEDVLIAQVAGRGKQPNLSFFAFTATPKAKTLQMFGRKARAADGDEVFEPSRLYSMRQAIEEGFIVDVLRSYTTYDTFFKIAKASPDNPEVDPNKAKAQIARYVTLHPENLAQRAQIVVDHFQSKTAPKMKGKAKAMVVTSSREHAVRFTIALKKYIAAKDFDLGVLVAFSGKVSVDGAEYSESSMNGFSENETARRFDTDDYRIMVVAEKFQTGFDQPLLHTMYVDKTLSGLAAVQTLSRLNRRHDDKEDTFVLDFRNDTDDIAKAFEPYYGKTMAIPTDPNEMGDARMALAGFGVIWLEIPDPVIDALRSDASDAQAKVYAALEPALARFAALNDEQQDEFRDALKRYINIYSFMSQVVPYTDQQMEDWYVFGRALRSVLPRVPGSGGDIDVSSMVELTHLKVSLAESESDGSLDADEGELEVIFGGDGAHFEVEEETLAEIIRQINDQLGRTLTKADQIVFDQMEKDWLENDQLLDQANNNDVENFGLAFAKVFDSSMLDRLTKNEDLVMKILDSTEIKNALEAFYVERIYNALREQG